tara:strand:- start:1159 stop:1440 length:282 start_codon:yes stop_codon:yes gene_type:complete
MITKEDYTDEKLTAKQYVNMALESMISIWLEQKCLVTDDDFMDDELLENSFYFTWVDLHDLKKMTLRERKEVVRIYDNQIRRLLKVVDPDTRY